MEYVTARDNKKLLDIILRYLQLAIRNEEELYNLLSSPTIVEVGVLKCSQEILLLKKEPLISSSWAISTSLETVLVITRG